jgi:hypothetical protein
MDEVFSSWPGMTDQPIIHLYVGYFTDGISFVWEDTHFARYTVVTLDAVTEAHPLPIRTSEQKAELQLAKTLVPSYYCLYSLFNKIRDKGKIVSAW